MLERYMSLREQDGVLRFGPHAVDFGAASTASQQVVEHRVGFAAYTTPFEAFMVHGEDVIAKALVAGDHDGAYFQTAQLVEGWKWTREASIELLGLYVRTARDLALDEQFAADISSVVDSMGPPAYKLATGREASTFCSRAANVLLDIARGASGASEREVVRRLDEWMAARLVTLERVGHPV